ncbi:MAG: hypothetical protein CBC25_01330 [Pelagibacteraceae bacterium TMED65]|nr:hypothetical protein [Rickettsiales bacterium]OUU53130.1 MAG: hypothetical protein CBC25_01330 [Pelagibacteraceae bacterium TMED65]|tara:strand:+ start:2929 stop:3207 length:279 start_codon:yes stop_codon:yes gene_type:complete
MEEKLELILKLLKEASSPKNIQELNNIQEELQKISTSLENQDQTKESKLDNQEIIDKISTIKEKINSLDKKNQKNFEIFSEFKNYIENRKIK